MIQTHEVAPRCPLCGRPIDPIIRRLQRPLAPHLDRILRAAYPHWEARDGACPDCVHEAALQARAERSPRSLQEQLLTPFPVYPPDQSDILPTPHRVRAHPRYAANGVTIAYLDSGFFSHPDLARPAGRIACHVDATAPDFAERARVRQRQATSWHGLMVSAVGAGSGYLSGQRYPGIAVKASLVLVKTGNRRGPRITERDIQRALNWVIANHRRFNIRIVNISLGGDVPSTGQLTWLDQKVEQAAALGMVVVAAAGNSGQARIIPPASAPSAITVGGMDDQNALDAGFRRLYHSSYGRGAGGVAKPDVIAPAAWLAAPMLPGTREHNEAQFLWRLLRASDAEMRGYLQSTYALARFSKATLSLPPDGIRRAIRRRLIDQKYIHPHYQHVEGTSMAASIVSAVAAQMLEAYPGLSPEEVRRHLRDTADPLPGVDADRQGSGLIDGGRAVASALRSALGHAAGRARARRGSISFVYCDKYALEVALVGGFNAWQPESGRMEQSAPGVWRLCLPRPARGVYPYKFLIDGMQWIADPEDADRIEDGYGGFNSLLTVE